MILRLDQVELTFVRVVIVGDVLIGNIDLRNDFFVQDLVDRDRSPDVPLEVGRSNFLILQSLVEFFLRERSLVIVELLVDFIVGREQPQLLGTPHQDLVFDHLVQNVQAKCRCLLANRRLLRRRNLVVVVLVDLGAKNLPSVHSGHHIATLFGIAG